MTTARQAEIIHVVNRLINAARDGKYAEKGFMKEYDRFENLVRGLEFPGEPEAFAQLRQEIDDLSDVIRELRSEGKY